MIFTWLCVFWYWDASLLVFTSCFVDFLLIIHRSHFNWDSVKFMSPRRLLWHPNWRKWCEDCIIKRECSGWRKRKEKEPWYKNTSIVDFFCSVFIFGDTRGFFLPSVTKANKRKKRLLAATFIHWLGGWSFAEGKQPRQLDSKCAIDKCAKIHYCHTFLEDWQSCFRDR